MWFAGPAFSAMSRPLPKRQTSPAPSKPSPPPEGSAAQLNFVSNNVTLTFHTDGTATATVAVLNPGQKVDVNFMLVVFPSGQAVPAKAAVAKCSAGLNSVSLSFSKSFPALPSSLTGAAIEVAPDPPAIESPPKVELCADRTMRNKPLARGALLPHAQAIPVTLSRLTGLSTFLVPLGVGLVSGLLFVGVLVGLRRVKRRPRPDRHTMVGAGSIWNAKDNWVTNLAGALGLIGTFLTAASGSSSALFPGIQLTNFTLLLALWTALIVLAPLLLAFGATQGSEGVEISPGILFGIGALTVGAAWAEVATGALLVDYSIASWPVRGGMWMVLFLFGTILFFYAVANTWRGVKRTLTAPAPAAPAPAAPAPAAPAPAAPAPAAPAPAAPGPAAPAPESGTDTSLAV
jgi:pyruvate/2-oxoglutarate dehydrogenase complex dihydrolipoamide acyltransferase (E2) component